MNVLVIGTIDNLALNVVRCLRMSGMVPHVMSSRSLVRARFSRYRASWVKAEATMFNPPFHGAAAHVNRCCEEKGIGVVIGADMAAIEMLCSIQNSLTANVFPISQLAELQMLNNKWSFSQFLREHQLPVPVTVLVETMDQLESIPLKYPLIVKPLEMQGGNGVGKLNSLVEARAHLRDDCDANRLPLLFQEFIPGADVDLSILANHGEVVEWTIQKRLSNGALEFVEDEQILALGKKIAATLSFHGVAHFDMRRDERDGVVKFLECNPRFWATLRESLWNGTNFVESGIRLIESSLPQQTRVNRRLVYTFPSKALRAFMTGDISVVQRFSQEGWQDAWQTLSDPWPFGCEVMAKLKGLLALRGERNTSL